MTRDQKIIKNKLELLELAKHLGGIVNLTAPARSSDCSFGHSSDNGGGTPFPEQPVMRCAKQVPSQSEEVLDDPVNRKKPLRLSS
jgi:hypothetical protein